MVADVLVGIFVEDHKLGVGGDGTDGFVDGLPFDQRAEQVHLGAELGRVADETNPVAVSHLLRLAVLNLVVAAESVSNIVSVERAEHVELVQAHRPLEGQEPRATRDATVAPNGGAGFLSDVFRRGLVLRKHRRRRPRLFLTEHKTKLLGDEHKRLHRFQRVVPTTRKGGQGVPRSCLDVRK